MRNIISVDVEDYFHPTEVGQADVRGWDAFPGRVEQSTERVVDLFALHKTRATFFILGWVAKRHPRLVRRIVEAGHEVGCHSFAHRLVYDLTPAEFRADTRAAVRAIEDAGGVTPRSYRAPSFSITEKSIWALDILAELGFTHDSSIYPIPHDRYGIPDFGRDAKTLETPSGSLMEVPIATVELSGGRLAPVGGGGYLRLLPYRYTAAGIRRMNAHGETACVYFHPWEIDADQPRLARGLIARVRTYYGLSRMAGKVDHLLRDFRFVPLGERYPMPEPVHLRAAGD